MADIANLKVGANTYSIKDTTARNTANTAKATAESAESKADQAIADSASATQLANQANTTANNALGIANTANAGQENANTKIDGASIVGNYTENTQTLEITLALGGSK